MAGEKPQKINIGFEGGQVLGARALPPEVARLREALGSGAGWHDLAAEDGTVAVDLGKLVYLLVESEDQRVGFGS